MTTFEIYERVYEMLPFWTGYEKHISCAFYEVIELTQLALDLKTEELKSDCPYGSMNNLVWHFKKMTASYKKRKTSSQS